MRIGLGMLWVLPLAWGLCKVRVRVALGFVVWWPFGRLVAKWLGCQFGHAGAPSLPRQATRRPGDLLDVRHPRI
eukprot:7358130-Lingulodinium_polyedra.AAC.1